MMPIVRYNRRRAALSSLAYGARMAYRYRRPLVTLGKRLRSGVEKLRSYKRSNVSRVNRTYVRDPASYRQLSTIRSKAGRPLSAKFRDLQLMKTVSVPLRFHFGNVNDINAATGVYWLSQQQYNVSNYRLPVYLFNLFTISQLSNGTVDANKQAIPAFELYRNTGTGAYTWGPVPGKSVTDGATLSYVKERIAPTASTDHIIGRKGMLDWTRVRMCIWGKKKNPTQVRVRLIRFTDEEFCPEFTLNRSTGYTTTGTSIAKVNEYWENECKYLLNGPQGSAPRSDRKKYIKVLKEFVVNINPIDAAAETDASDPRGHMKHLDIFNRWGRILDFTEPDVTDGLSINDLRNVNKFNQPSREYCGYLRRADQAVYVMVESMQPAEDTQAATTGLPRPAPVDGQDLTASFDIAIDTNFTVIEKAV